MASYHCGVCNVDVTTSRQEHERSPTHIANVTRKGGSGSSIEGSSIEGSSIEGSSIETSGGS